ncbi:MAG TPA: NUDIX hydrolase [Bryobacteraceae bacterium]|nr:NUDIX hydrolase [Bryobacteraceae bacterium]
MHPKWLDWAQRLQAIAQSGLAYDPHQYDRERYEAVQEIAAGMMAASAECGITAVRELFAAQAGYATPKVDVRGVVFRDDRILLVREREDGGWTLPGGWADVNESPAQATVREVREESGYDTRAVKLLALYDRNLHGHPPIAFHAYKIFFHCQLLGGAPAASGETTGVDWFAANDLPVLSVSRVTAAQIRRFFEHSRHPEWPTDFD